MPSLTPRVTPEPDNDPYTQSSLESDDDMIDPRLRIRTPIFGHGSRGHQSGEDDASMVDDSQSVVDDSLSTYGDDAPEIDGTEKAVTSDGGLEKVVKLMRDRALLMNDGTGRAVLWKVIYT